MPSSTPLTPASALPPVFKAVFYFDFAYSYLGALDI